MRSLRGVLHNEVCGIGVWRMKAVLTLIGVIIAVATIAGVIAFIAERIGERKTEKSKFQHKPYGIYERFIKRPMDCVLASAMTIVLSPLLLILTILGAIQMGGNPFFTQERPGKDEKIFKLIKFRTMNNKKDENGQFLSDEARLTKYGKWLRSTSLDELPELLNIVKGDMSFIGPRPLLVKYLPFYSETQKLRHSVRPGLTGYAQAHGRNHTTWDERFGLDLEYVNHITLFGDICIIFDTVKAVLSKDGISQEGQATMSDFIDYVTNEKDTPITEEV